MNYEKVEIPPSFFIFGLHWFTLAVKMGYLAGYSLLNPMVPVPVLGGDQLDSLSHIHTGAELIPRWKGGSGV